MLKAILIVIAVALLAGCSFVSSTQRLDLSPFAANTMALSEDVEYGLTEANRLVNLRDYWHLPELTAHRAEWSRVRRLINGVVAYSIEVTTLGNSTLSGPERCGALADYVDELARPVISKGILRITPAGLDSIITDIRSRKDLLDGLNGAQPIIDEVARIARNVFEEVHESLDLTARALMDAIDERNAKVVEWDKARKEIHYRIFDSFALLGDYRRGDDSALEKLFELDSQLREYSASGRSLTGPEIDEIENRLVLKMNLTRDAGEIIAPDLERYHREQVEAADLYAGAAHQLRRARVTIMVWLKAHQALSAGITDPARFNMFDLTKKAVGVAL